MENYIKVFLFKFFLKINFLVWWSYFIYFCFPFFTAEGKTEGQKLSIKKEKWVYLSGHYIIMSPRCVCMFCTVCYQKCQIELLEIGNIYIIYIMFIYLFRAKKESWSWIAMSSPTVICFWNFNYVFKKDLWHLKSQL